jgi:hypothetical protein
MEAFKVNLTKFVATMQDVLPAVRVWALHTSVQPRVSGEVQAAAKGTGMGLSGMGARVGLEARVTRTSLAGLDQVTRVNTATRTVARQMQIGLADWEAMVHLGWPRDAVLFDAHIPRRNVLNAVGVVYLNALAALPPSPSRSPTPAVATGCGDCSDMFHSSLVTNGVPTWKDEQGAKPGFARWRARMIAKREARAAVGKNKGK